MKIKVIIYDIFTDSFIEVEELITEDNMLSTTVKPSIIGLPASGGLMAGSVFKDIVDCMAK